MPSKDYLESAGNNFGKLIYKKLGEKKFVFLIERKGERTLNISLAI
jgi:hypothetical protein